MKKYGSMKKAQLISEIEVLKENAGKESEWAHGTIRGLKEKIRELEGNLESKVCEEIEKRLAKERLLLLQCHRESTEELTGNIAHQWRQPLNIIGLTVQKLQFDFAKKEVDNAYLDELAGDIMNIVKQMSRTVQSFRNFLQADKQRQKFCMKQTVHRVLSFVDGSMKSAGIAIRVDEQGKDFMISGYPNEFSLIMLNILNKSKKALVDHRTANPLITVGFIRRGTRSLVTIHDNGGCIPEHMIGRVFEPFSTVGTRGTGTGMELYLTKIIVEQKMGGKITAENRNSGLEFRIEL